MKKNYRWTIIALSLTLIFISIGYAAYSSILNISGNAKINKSIWSIHYDYDSINVASGTDSGYTLISPLAGPTLNSDSTKLSFETDLKINEETSFTIDVINDGTFTARVSKINLIVASKTENDANYTTLANIGTNKWSNDYLDFSVVWTDGFKNILDTVDLAPSTSKNMTIMVRYKQPEDFTLLPGEDVNFKFDLDIEYTQVDNMTYSSNVTPKIATDVSSSAEVISTLENNTDKDVILRMDNDIDLSSYTDIIINNNTTIEFNGNTLTVASNSIQVSDGGYLLLEDTTGSGGLTGDRGLVNVLDGGTLVINSGTYTTTNYTRGSGIYAEDGANITINGGVINAAYYSIGTSGDVDITINGGELNSTSTSKNGTWAYSVKLESGRFTMNGGKIVGVHGALALDGSVEATINNGEIYVYESSVGANDGYYCMYVTDTSFLKVHNGIFTNYGTRSVIYTNSSNNIELYGGKYTALGNTLFTGDNIIITGGSYSHDVSNYVESGNLIFNSPYYEIEA